MQFPRFALFTLLTFIAGACSETRAPFAPEVIEVPTATSADGPRLSGGGDQALVLSWMESAGDSQSLRFSEYPDGSWSEPGTVIDGVDMFVNWADMPSVQPMGRDRLAAHWLQMSGEATYAYDVVFSRSLDGGMTWSDPVRPHSDGTQTEHGFVSMFPEGNTTGLLWLDGRKMVNERTKNPFDTGMTLRSAVIDLESAIHNEQLVDELICDCCQTDIAIARSGPVAVYRDRTPDEIRDISVTRRIDGSWQQPVTLAADEWNIPGCPVNGPAVVADGAFVAAAWFTAAGDSPVVKLAMSDNSGESFRFSTEIERGHVLGQVGMVPLGNNRVAASWLRKAPNEPAELRLQAIGMNGDRGELQIVATDVSPRSVPQLGIRGADLVLVWTETSNNTGNIRSARVAAASL